MAGDAYAKTFTVSSATGAAANADSTPTGTVYVNGAATAATVTVTNPATGVYKAAVASLPGTAGDAVELLISATVGGIAAKSVVDAIRLVAFTPTDSVRLGLTALPNAAAGATGGVHVLGGTGVVVATSNDKTGYKLASDGLDSISTTAPAGVASNFREMMIQTWRRFFRKATRTSTQIKTYADDGTTVLTTQTISASGTNESQGAAS